ncbi:MAG: 3-phosphoshikimate 1-carboxyvinyltransferase [Syntrophales bacterium]|jgi:3-phosphoshikimate 1-carboxyvinyltransferase|nr:3-phosphoshikimate 1-carboxyvinyltransferase [Syntrophales bacterium]
MKKMSVIHIEPFRCSMAEVTVPGSKSYTQRALVAASLARGSSVLVNPLLSEDTMRIIEALQAMGLGVAIENGDIRIEGAGGVLSAPQNPIYLGNNGTAMRFLVSLSSLGRGPVTLTGDARLCERPIRPLMNYLGLLGVPYRYLGQDGFPPVEIHASGLRGGELTIKNTESSQYISSIMLAAPYADNPVTLTLEGGIVSRPYIDMTLQVMTDFGVPAEVKKKDCYTFPAKTAYQGRRYVIEGDASSASYFFLAAMLCEGTVRVNNLTPRSTQGDLKFLDLLEGVGGEVRYGDNWISVTGKKMKEGRLVVSMADMPDMVPTVAILAAFREGTTEIRRVAHLRIKESNRLAVLVAELGKMGIDAREEGDSLVIVGGKPNGATIHTYNDHRIAMSFAVAGLVIPGISIQNPGCVDKSFPDFWKIFEELRGGERD